MNFLYKVRSEHDDSIHATKEWRRYEADNYICANPICGRFRRTLYPKPIDVFIRRPPLQKRLRVIVNLSVATLYHMEFIERIRSEMKGFVFGKCYLPDGTLVDEYVTCYTKDYIVIRGQYGSRYNECPECGTISSTPNEPKYVLRRYLSDANVYQDAIMCLYLSEELAMKLDFSPWPEAHLEPVPIRDIPVDRRKLLCDPESPPWEYLY